MQPTVSPLQNRLLLAGVAVVVLTMLGVLWLAVGLELLRTDVDVLGQILRDNRQTVGVSQPDAGLAALRRDVAALAVKIDALGREDTAQAVDKLAAEVRHLAKRLEAKPRPVKATKTGASANNADDDEVVRIPPPQPLFGPGLPAYPGY